MVKYFVFIFLFFLSFSCVFSQVHLKENSVADSIIKLQELSKDNTIEYKKRIDFAKASIVLSKKQGIDSIILKSQKNLSYLFIVNNKLEAAKKINFENLKLAAKIKDSSAVANAYQNLGYSYYIQAKYDSAYYHNFKAVNLYKKLNNNIDASAVLLNMAVIQKNERDFVGAEINAIDAKKLIINLPESDYNLDTLWSLHNLIATIYAKLKQYDKALEYNYEAYKYANKMNDGYSYKLSTQASIASIYRRKGDYTKAINKYNEILKNKNILNFSPALYASTLSNRAHAKFLSGINTKNEIEKPYRKAISLAKKEKNYEIEIYTYFYISKYFENIKQTDSALKYINKSYKIAKVNKFNDFLLETLVFKASLKKDSSNYFLKEHIKLNDSLVNSERSIRNKFAIIDFETDIIKKEKDNISKQNLWLIISLIVLLFTALFIYAIKTQREKNKEFQLVQQQQKANEEIYNLMLSQQDKIDEARALEKKRISQDIHDGVLGRLFGIRLSLDSLNQSKTEQAIISRSNYINELKDIEQDIRKVSHDLNADFITNTSFLSLITTLIETQCSAYSLDYNLDAEQNINWELLNNKVKINLYRIIQECLLNTYKHANANIVIVNIQQENNLISLIINDDGVGFNTNKTKVGIGLKNIKSRVSKINGELYITKRIPKGTSITVMVPV